LKRKDTSEEIENSYPAEEEEEAQVPGGRFTRLFAIVSIILIVCVVGLYYGGSSGILRTEETGTITYAGYEESSFAVLSDGLAIASSQGIQIINGEGELVLSDKFEMLTPAVATSGEYAVFFDIGGKAVKVVNNNQIIFEPNNGETVVSASVNEKGYTVLCTQCDGYNGHMSVFAPDGTERFEWFSVDGYVLRAVIGPDSKTVAVLTVTATGSKIVFFDINISEEQSRYECENTVFFDICFNSADEVSAISQNKLINLTVEGNEKSSYDFGVRYLKTYSFGKNGTHTVVLSDYQAGGSCDIISLKNGKIKGSALGLAEIFKVTSNEKRIAVLMSDGIRVYSRGGKQKGEFTTLSGVLDVLISDGGTVFATQRFSATIYKINKGIFDLF